MSDLIIFECPYCGQSLDAPQSFAGKDGHCPACKHAVMIPAAYEFPGKTPEEELDSQIESTSIQADDSAMSSTVRIDVGEELHLPKAAPRVMKIKRQDRH